MGNYNNNAGRYTRPAGSYKGGQGAPNKQAAPAIQPRTLPAAYIDQAEQAMQELQEDGRQRVTTSKLRNILSLVSDIYNTESGRTGPQLLPESADRLQMARVRIAYECGRDKSVQRFVDKTGLLAYIKGVGTSRTEFIRFARYMEALVAYHRYYGGDD